VVGRGESAGVENDAMTDVVKIARERRATVAAEIARLDDFIRMAEALAKYGQRPDCTRATGAYGPALDAHPADHDADANFAGDEVKAPDGVTGTTRTIDDAADVERDVSDISSDRTSAHEASTRMADRSRADPGLLASDEAASGSPDELVLMNPLSSDPGPVDIHIGQRLRQRRWMMGMSQQQLGDIVGVERDQIEKFETGTSRISVRCMWDIAAAMEVPVSYFFVNLDGPAVDTGEVRSDTVTDEAAPKEAGAAPPNARSA
jgi:transcriptional regulator with XRE-family HTH domain